MKVAEGVCEMASHGHPHSRRHYCENAAVAEIEIDEEGVRTCADCLVEFAQLTKVAVSR